MRNGRSTANALIDPVALRAADAFRERVLADLLGGHGGPRGVVVKAPAGAGKSHLVGAAAQAARDLGLRVAVAAPTNEQAFGLVRTLVENLHRGPVAFMPSARAQVPETIRSLPGVRTVTAKEADAEPLVVGTLDKLGDAFARGSLAPFEVLLVDESYQADSARYFAAAGLAPLHLLVGDPGQISPFAVIDDPFRWRGLPEDPLQTAVGVLLRNHPGTPVHGLPVTRRLNASAVGVARWFYPDLPFQPVVRDGTRALALCAEPRAHLRERRLDAALDHAARHGWAHVRLPRAAVLQADPEVVAHLADLVQRLFERAPRICCERQPDFTALAQGRVAVGVSHNDQKDLVRRALADRGLGGVVVETANKLQGLEFEVVFAWHPLAGLSEPDSFHLEPGRLCVLLTRHRQACVVVGRVGDEAMLEDQVPPATPAYLGDTTDPVLDGWEVHRSVYAELEPHRFDLSV